MQIDVEALLAPISEDAPCGVDTADDNDRLEIDDVFEAVQRLDFEDDEPNWGALSRDVAGLFSKSKDLWLAVYLARAGAKGGDLEQVAGAMQVLAGLIERYWDEAYPTLDDVGVPGRKSRVSELAQRRAFLTALEAIPLLSDSRHGDFTAAQLEEFALDGGASNVGFTRIMQADGAARLAETAGRIEAVASAAKAADAAFNAKAGGDGPDFQPLHQSIRRLARAIAPFLGEGAAAGGGDSAADGVSSEEQTPYEAGPMTAAPGGPSAPGQIRNREDVVKALDAICAYYKRSEPTSPVPLALERARAWVNLDFLTVLRDIAPDSLNDARRVLKLGNLNDDDD